MKKFLIISSNRLGDSILSSGIVCHYKRLYPGCQITFVCGLIPFELFKFVNDIDRLIPLRKRKYSIHWFFLWTKVFFNFWDSVVDLRGTIISIFLMSKKRVIYRSLKKKIHKVRMISNYFGNEILHPQLNIIEEKKLISNYVQKINNLNKNKILVAISASANWSGKKWPLGNYVELIKKLIKNDQLCKAKFILFGSNNEKSDSRTIKSYFKDEIIDLVGVLKFNEIFLILKKCKLFIGNDSGLMHLAAVSGIPTVGLFGPSDIHQYHPWGDKTLAIRTPETPERLMNTECFSHKKTKTLMGSLKVSKVEKEVINFYKQMNYRNEL